MHFLQLPGGSCPPVVVPDDFIAESILTKYGVHNHLQTMTHRRIAVKVNASGAFQHSMQFNEPDSHVNGIGLGFIAANRAYSVNSFIQGFVLIRQFPPPGVTNITESPSVSESGNSVNSLFLGNLISQTPYRSLILFVAVEGRVKVNQVHSPTAYSAKNRKVVSHKYLPVLDGSSRHGEFLPRSLHCSVPQLSPFLRISFRFASPNSKFNALF